jgi:uncharacterized cofD-like protein
MNKQHEDMRIVVIGGGTGSVPVLVAMKRYTNHISALVNMVDDGGSTGRLRAELGVLPPGDIRQSLVALSNAPKDLQQLFNFRFTAGELQGHPLGNLFLSAAESMTGDFDDAVRITSNVLDIVGEVIPITIDKVELVAEVGDMLARGQDYINNIVLQSGNSAPQLRLEPEAAIHPAALAAIQAAEFIIIAPGDIYTSIGPSLVVRGVREALVDSPAKLIYICNAMSKKGHTSGWSVADHVNEIERLGGKSIDYVLYNTETPPSHLLKKYAEAGEGLVVARQEEFQAAHYTAVGHRLIASDRLEIIAGDNLAAHRSLIRHDAEKVAGAVAALLN